MKYGVLYFLFVRETDRCIFYFYAVIDKKMFFFTLNIKSFMSVMFKECLKNSMVPFIITDELKMFYYRGLHEWPHVQGYLMDTCLTA